MWWSDKRISALMVFLCFTLAGCGFEPLYKQSSSVPSISARFAEIEIPNIPNREGQILRNDLIDRLYTQGRPVDSRYVLKIDPIDTAISSLGIRKDATATREQITLSIHMRLVDRQSNAVLLERFVRAVGSYDILDSQYQTLVSRQTVSERVLKELSDNIVTELSLYLERKTP